jgi:hypothetical protein
MRLAGLLLALLFVLLPVHSAASDPQAAATSDTSPPFEMSPELFAPGMMAAGQQSLPAGVPLHADLPYWVRTPAEVTCLKLRTYIMAREDPHSDLTRLVRYRTCTPASRFDMRNAILTDDDERITPKQERHVH